MSLENQVAVLSQNVGNLVNRVTTQANAWDAQVAQAVQTVNNHVANARAEMPFIRVSPNQRLLHPNSVSDPYSWHFYGHQILGYEEIRDNVQPANRTQFETEFLSSCFGEVPMYISTSFYVMRYRALPGAGLSFVNKHANAGPNYYTFAMYAKVLTGSIGVDVFKTFNNGWRLVGWILKLDGLGYKYYDISVADNTEVYFALPACVVGRFPFDAYQWGFFPQVAIPSFADTTDLNILKS